MSAGGSTTLLWLASDRWLAVAADLREGLLSAALAGAVGGAGAATDVSNGRTVIRADGRSRREIVARRPGDHEEALTLGWGVPAV